MGKTAFLYAGQGSQKTGMGSDFYESFPEFKAVYDSIDIGFDIKEVCFDNPDDILLQTQYTQPCIVAFACGVTEILNKMDLYPDYTCGLSLGEYSALYSAGVWNLKDVMKVITERGKAMAEASEGIDSAMNAIIGLSVEEVEVCCKKAEGKGLVSICNLNCPGQVVIGGDSAAVTRAAEMAKEVGARRCIPLSVSGPFHTKYMRPAAVRLEKVLQTVKYNEQRCEILFNFLGGPRNNDISITELLVDQIQYTVKMQQCIEYLIDNDVRTIIEIGPGNALTGFVKKVIKAKGMKQGDFSLINIDGAEDIKGLQCLEGIASKTEK